MTATTLLRRGTVYSPADPFATAMLLDGGRVAWVGSEGAADGFARDADEVIDLAGALVTPAFVDAHVHATATGLALTGLDLSGCADLAECLARVQAYAANARGGVVLGHGWDETSWPDRRPPTRQELDQAAPGALVYLSRVDVHSCVASSGLLAAVPGIGGQDGYDDSGHLTRDAHHAVRKVAYDSVSAAQRRMAQRATRTHAASLGIGVLHELGGPQVSSAADLAAFLELALDEPGPDVVGYWGELGGVEQARELGARGAAGDLFVDGALGSHTACLRAPYADADSHGHAYLDAGQIRDHVVACTQAGLQAGFHAIGDGATAAVVSGLRQAAEIVGRPALQRARHRLEHAEMLDADMVAALAEAAVVASMQPVFDGLWGGPHGMYSDRLGADRAADLNPFADLAAAGVVLAFGSDAPVTPLGPWEAVRAAAFHTNERQRISVRAAFGAHTRGGWRAAGIDDAGVLVPGAPATYAVWESSDLVVQAPDRRVSAWSTDPRSGVPGLPDLTPGTPAPTCLRTVVSGRTIHEA